MQDDENNNGNLFQGRRATLEDLPQLRELWRASHLPVPELEKRFTEFQVVTDSQNRIAGAVALQVAGHHGHLHSEAYADLDQAQPLRALLWRRIHQYAKNHGLIRLWTLPTVAFFREQGMTDADEAARAKLPPQFGSPNADWLTLKMKEDAQPQLSLEQEFAIFADTRKQETQQTLRQAQMLRIAAYGFLAIVFGALAVLMFIVFRRLPNRRR